MGKGKLKGIVLEYVELCLHKIIGGLNRIETKILLWDIISAVEYLHDNGIMHRDLSPTNILVSEKRNYAKLCDFGSARRFARSHAKDKSIGQYSTYMTTRWYRSPEQLKGDAYGPSVDVWAIGCIFAEMVRGSPLFPGSSEAEQIQLHNVFFDNPDLSNFTLPVRQLLKGCLERCPQKRMTPQQLKRLPYFFEIYSFMLSEII